MTHDLDLHGDVEAYVLGALDDTEATAFERHLDACPSCQREVASYVPVLRALREVTLPAAPPLRTRPKNVVPFRALLATAAVALFTIGGLGGASMQHAMSSDMVTVAQMGATSAENIPLRGSRAEGRAIVGEARRRTAFVVAGLPEPGPNRDYQVWVTHGALSSPGVLHRSMQGYEVLIVPGDVLRGARRITITLEVTGGSERMTGTPIVSDAAAV
jgi:anti-sigma-K factor RskA